MIIWKRHGNGSHDLVFFWSSGQWSSPDSNRVQVTDITAWTKFLCVILLPLHYHNMNFMHMCNYIAQIQPNESSGKWPIKVLSWDFAISVVNCDFITSISWKFTKEKYKWTWIRNHSDFANMCEWLRRCAVMCGPRESTSHDPSVKNKRTSCQILTICIDLELAWIDLHLYLSTIHSPVFSFKS